jgi:DNA invertase Pin-like site-specific DNA recombinase
MGRLRRELRPLADVRATGGGFTLVPRGPGAVRLLLPPIESPDAAVVALLADGEAWSTSALALALGSSQRTVQRALRDLEEANQARSIGRGRAQRWLAAPVARFATALLLPGSAGFG